MTGPAPSPISVTWLGTWLQRNPSWNWQTLTYGQFGRLFRQSVRTFSPVIATDDPDLAAGAQHCASAAGPAPANPLAAVAAWAEHGHAPTSILATVTDPATGAVTLSRPLCAYPLTARYRGHGSTSQASSFTCASGKP